MHVSDFRQNIEERPNFEIMRVCADFLTSRGLVESYAYDELLRAKRFNDIKFSIMEHCGDFKEVRDFVLTLKEKYDRVMI